MTLCKMTQVTTKSIQLAHILLCNPTVEGLFIKKQYLASWPKNSQLLFTSCNEVPWVLWFIK